MLLCKSHMLCGVSVFGIDPQHYILLVLKDDQIVLGGHTQRSSWFHVLVPQRSRMLFISVTGLPGQDLIYSNPWCSWNIVKQLTKWPTLSSMINCIISPFYIIIHALDSLGSILHLWNDDSISPISNFSQCFHSWTVMSVIWLGGCS